MTDKAIREEIYILLNELYISPLAKSRSLVKGFFIAQNSRYESYRSMVNVRFVSEVKQPNPPKISGKTERGRAKEGSKFESGDARTDVINI